MSPTTLPYIRFRANPLLRSLDCSSNGCLDGLCSVEAHVGNRISGHPHDLNGRVGSWKCILGGVGVCRTIKQHIRSKCKMTFLNSGDKMPARGAKRYVAWHSGSTVCSLSRNDAGFHRKLWEVAITSLGATKTLNSICIYIYIYICIKIS